MGKRVSQKVVAAVLERDGGFCVIRMPGCQVFATVADHRANRGMGGARSLDGMSNLIAACGFCNGLKEDSSGLVREALMRRGVRVVGAGTHERTAQRARETPVEYPGGQLWLLDDDGTKRRVGHG